MWGLRLLMAKRQENLWWQKVADPTTERKAAHPNPLNPDRWSSSHEPARGIYTYMHNNPAALGQWVRCGEGPPRQRQVFVALGIVMHTECTQHVKFQTCPYMFSNEHRMVLQRCEQEKDEHLTKPYHSSGAVWESRWPFWAVRPKEPSGFRGRKDLLNRASALVTTCP